MALIGDIGGQREVFARVLADLDVEPRTGRLPAGLAVVQVGDLIRAASDELDNDGCVELAHRTWAANPHRWIQLLGNHDLAALGGPRRPTWTGVPAVSARTRERLRHWWTRRQPRLAVAIQSRELSHVLVTHAGLTRGRWRRLGALVDAHAAARAINADVGLPVERVILGGALTGRDAGPDAAAVDVTWAEVNTELYAPWLAAQDAPFSQVHGHASPWNWATGTWWPNTPPSVRAATQVHHDVRRTSTRLTADDGQPTATCIDWCLGDQPTTGTWPVLTLTVSRLG